MTSDITVLVTGAGGSATENVVDSLRRADSGYRIIGADVSPVRLHLSTADDRCILPPADEVAYEASLRAALRAYDVGVLHAQPDSEVRAISRLRNRLEVAMFLPSPAAIELAADKAEFTASMTRAGVAVPESTDFADRESVAIRTRELLSRHERVWIRARVGAGARASLPVRSPDQALAWIDWWVDEKGMHASEFMGAEMLPGREFAYQSVWQHGALVAGQARERDEYLNGF